MGKTIYVDEAEPNSKIQLMASTNEYNNTTATSDYDNVKFATELDLSTLNDIDNIISTDRFVLDSEPNKDDNSLDTEVDLNTSPQLTSSSNSKKKKKHK